MKKTIFLTVLLAAFFVSAAIADPGDTKWTRTYGGSAADAAWSVRQTSDGGYIIVGNTNSFGAGAQDIWLVKTDANGDSLWTRTYGGSADEYGRSVQQTTDGGYIITGYTTSFGAGSQDVYLVKTDSDGDTLWTRTYGGSADDGGRSVQQTTDGAYIIVGSTMSFGAGTYDFYLLKTDSNGDSLWTRTYGGSAMELGNSVQQTTDGGYIVAGHTMSFGAGYSDYWLLKTDASGDTLWTRTYGGSSGNDWAYSVQQTTDGGYVVGGYTTSFGVRNTECYLVKTDANGDTLWTRTYGGAEYESLYSVQHTSDGGYIVAGFTTSFGAGDSDVWLLKIAGEPLQPDVSIQITPDDPPVTVPQGGSFGFTGTLTNNIEDPQVTDAWTMAVGPQKETYGPFKMRNDVDLEPYQTRAAQFNQHVPNLAPLGFYTYIAYCGDYPATVVDSSLFQIEVVAGPLTKAGEAGWVLTGSFLEGDLTDVPSEFALLSNYPNPFNAQTVIQYQLPASSSVKLEIYNLIGEKVATLLNGAEEAGYKSVTWDASEISSGIYFYKLSAGDYTETKRMMLVK